MGKFKGRLPIEPPSERKGYAMKYLNVTPDTGTLDIDH
jgi:hypothetical protein